MEDMRQSEMTILLVIGASREMGITNHHLLQALDSVDSSRLKRISDQLLVNGCVVHETSHFVLTKAGWQHLAELVAEQIADLDRADNARTASLFDPNLPILERDLVVRGGPRTVDPSNPHGRDPEPVQAPDLRFLNMDRVNP